MTERTPISASTDPAPDESIAVPPAPERLSPEGRRALVLLLIAVFVVFLNETMMNVAIPTIIADLGVTPAEGQWLTTAFALTMAVVIPITGWLLQRVNTRPVYVLALAVFSLGTLIAALSPVFELLIVGRVVQAAGTAIMMPLMMTSVMTIVPMSIRGRIMGRVSIVMSLAPALGPTTGGILLDTFDGYWRGLFFVMLPISIAALVVGLVLIPNVSIVRRIPLDVPSVILSALGFSAFVYGLSSIGLAAESSAAVSPAVPIVVGALILLAFGWRQIVLQRRDAAFLDLRTFRARTYSVSIVAMALGMLTMFGLVIVMPIYLQYVLNLEPTAIGAIMLPGGLLMGLLGPFVGRLYDRYGPRPLVIPGAIAASVAAWTLMAVVTTTTSVVVIAATYTLLFLGFAFLFPPLFTSGLGSLPFHLYSHGSAIIATIQQVAGAAGAAIFTALLTVGMAARGSTDVTLADPQGIVDGTHLALLGGAIASLGLIATAFFVRKPVAPEVSEESLHGGH